MNVTTRPVRIFIALKDSPLRRAIKQILPMFSAEGEKRHCVEYVDSDAVADLTLFGDVRDIEATYSSKKTYGWISWLSNNKVKVLPENCIILGQSNMVLELVALIGSIRNKIEDGSIGDAKPVVAPAPQAELLPNALHILVIDDTDANITSALTTLRGHRVTTSTGYQQAMDILGREKFDVVLTDLHMPMSSRTMGEKFVLGQSVPYGVLLMIEAARQGANHVAVVTDLSHHDDPFSAAFDHFSRYPVTIDNAKVMMMHATMENGAKNWKVALDDLLV